MSEEEINGPEVVKKMNACTLAMIREVIRANGIYQESFRGTDEALGVIRDEYLEVEEMLRIIKKPEAADPADLKKLKVELIQLGAACIKGLYSFCDLSPELEEINGLYRFVTSLTWKFSGVTVQ